MDGLKILEDSNNLKKKREVISKNKGLMHACGHDGHMAIALTSAKILKDYKDILKGKIYFIFEQAEETCEGVGDVISFIKDSGFTVTRIGKDYISLRCLGSKKSRRFKGEISDEEFIDLNSLNKLKKQKQEKIEKYENINKGKIDESISYRGNYIAESRRL